jgi:hypothetical protein
VFLKEWNYNAEIICYSKICGFCVHNPECLMRCRLPEMAEAVSKCLGTYCGRTVDLLGNISSCGVSHIVR